MARGRPAVRELRDIAELYQDLRRRGHGAALAQLVQVRGSHYRRAGARMLLGEDGRSAGAISGGCLEADIRERARTVLATGEPAVAHYDMTAPEDVVWGLGLGCDGAVHVLIEPLADPLRAGLFAALTAEVEAGRPVGLATVFLADGAFAGAVGGRLLLTAQGEREGSDLPEPLASALAADLAAAFGEGRTANQGYRFPDGEAEVLLETVEPPIRLYVCGAGPDALPLVRLADGLGWSVAVVAPRASAAGRERFAELVPEGVEGPEILDEIPRDRRTAAVVMTHNYPQDLDLLRRLLASPVAYLGVLGPRERTQKLLADLSQEGIRVQGEDLRRLHAPVGVDLGAESAEEVALAMAAEIQAVLTGRRAGFLRDRPGPIHPPAAAAAVAALRT